MKIRITKDSCGLALWHLAFWLEQKTICICALLISHKGTGKSSQGPNHDKSPLQITGQGWFSTALTRACWAVSTKTEGVATPSNFFCALVSGTCSLSGTCVQCFQLQRENRSPPMVVVRAERGGQPQLKSSHVFDLLPPVLEQSHRSGEPEWWGLK